jgi:DNA-binding NtrC family response regulator
MEKSPGGSRPRVFVADDDEVTCRLLEECFAREGIEVEWSTDPRRAIDRILEDPPDAALLDLRMPGVDGLAVLRRVHARCPDLPVIVMTAFGSVETAVGAIHAGAFDYVNKPANVAELRATVQRALARRRETPAPLPIAGEDFAGLVGRAPAMIEVYKLIARAAAGSSTVLILGETGTGKELVARAIHRHGPRREKPFLTVDCTGLPETLLESELFGHVQGAFTGAVRDHPGLFARADGGTVFLDEIGELSPVLQAKLLRFLQEQQIRPVGGTQWRRVDVRVIAATHRDLRARVARGEFREDLYYRLNVLTIQLPPLRERREDLPLLVDFLVRRAAARAGKKVEGLSEAALEAIRSYHWPGNIRELAHVLERSVILCRGEVLGVEDLPAEILVRPPAAGPPDLAADRPTLEELKRRYVARVLEETRGNVSRAASILGLDRRSLRRMLQRYGLRRAEGGAE